MSSDQLSTERERFANSLIQSLLPKPHPWDVAVPLSEPPQRPVAEILRASKMAYSCDELRLHPLSTKQSKSAEGALADFDPFEMSPQLLPLVSKADVDPRLIWLKSLARRAAYGFLWGWLMQSSPSPPTRGGPGRTKIAPTGVALFPAGMRLRPIGGSSLATTASAPRSGRRRVQSLLGMSGALVVTPKNKVRKKKAGADYSGPKRLRPSVCGGHQGTSRLLQVTIARRGGIEPPAVLKI